MGKYLDYLIVPHEGRYTHNVNSIIQKRENDDPSRRLDDLGRIFTRKRRESVRYDDE